MNRTLSSCYKEFCDNATCRVETVKHVGSAFNKLLSHYEEVRQEALRRGEALPKELYVDQLTPKLISGYIRWLRDVEQLSASTVNSYRSDILGLWESIDDAPPLKRRKIRGVRPERLIPTAWSLAQLSRLVDEIRSLRGRRRNTPQRVRRSDFYLSMTLFLYDTGARLGAAMRLHPSDVDFAKNTAVLRANCAKTKTEQIVHFSQETADAMKLIIDHRLPRVWHANTRELRRQFFRLLSRAGLPCDRWHSFHCFRRTHATEVLVQTGSIEAAAESLGHSSIKMTQAHYIDTRLVPRSSPMSVLRRPTVDGA